MFNPNSKVTLSLSPKRKRSRANEPLDVGSPTAIGFNGVLGKKNHQSFDKQFINNNIIGGHTYQTPLVGHTQLNSIRGPKHTGIRGEKNNEYAIQRADSYEDLEIAELREQVARAKIRADTRAREEKKQLIEQLRSYDDESNRSICNTPPPRNVTPADFSLKNSFIEPNESYKATNRYNDDTAYARLKKVKDLSKLFRDIPLTSETYKMELGYFEHQCEMYEITNEQIKYEILLQKWPQKDVKDFWESTSRHERNYNNLYKFLEDKGCPLPKILRSRTASNAPIKYQDLRMEATKWAKATLDDRIKFFTCYLAPDNLKSEVRANFGHKIEEFHLRNRATFVGQEERHVDNTKNINYGVREPRFRTNRTRRRNNAGWYENQNKFYNDYGSNQPNQQYTRPGRDQGANFHSEKLCDLHLAHGENAFKCRMPNSCPMAHLINNQPKSDIPNSSQLESYDDGYRKPLIKSSNTAYCLSGHIVKNQNVKNITTKQSNVSKKKTLATRKPLASRLTGQVKSFHVRKGYGFIQSVEVDSDIFIHYSAITKNNPKKLMKSVRKGEIVQFDVVMSSKNLPRAANVTGLNNKPVQGSKYALDKKQNYSKSFKQQQKPQQNNYMNNSYHKVRNQHQKNKISNNYRRCYNCEFSPHISTKSLVHHERSYNFNKSQDTKSVTSESGCESDYESVQNMTTQNI